MDYTFEILGVLPVLHFFTYQHRIIQENTGSGVEYIGSHKCTLDAFLGSIEGAIQKRGWDFQVLAETVIDFWIQNPDGIDRWQCRLMDAGNQSLVVARIANTHSLRQEFERLMKYRL